MEPAQRQILHRWRVELVENINILDGLYSQLLSRNILTSRIVNRIKDNRTPQDQVEELLDELVQIDCFEQLCQALIGDGQEHIVRKFLRQTTSSLDDRQPDQSTATSSSSIVQNRPEFITVSQITTSSNVNISHSTSPNEFSSPSDVLTPSTEPLPMMSTSPPVRDPGFMDQSGLSRSDAVVMCAGMKPQERQLLRRWRVELVENIRMLDGLYNQLLSRNILTSRTVNRIKYNRTGEEQVEVLLDELQKKDCFDQFCDALIANDQEHIVQTFLKPTIPSVDGRPPDMSTVMTASSSVQRNESV